MTKRRCSKCGVNRQTKAYTGPRGRVCATCRRATRRRSSRASRLKNTYDITEDEYEALLVAQDGRCAICGGTRRYKLHVEHDHAVERERGVRASIRGLACARCNKLLRDCGDSIELLEALIAFLRNPPARGVLDEVHH